MKTKYKLLNIILSLFDGAGAGAGSAGGAAGASGDGAGSTGDTTSSSAPTRRGKSGEYSNVIFGKQAQASTSGQSGGTVNGSAAGSSTEETSRPVSSDTLEAKRKAYQELINGEYKDMYTEDTQRMINRRFSETKTLQAQVDSYQPIIDMMMSKYGISNGDAKKLSEAIQSDSDMWAEQAEEAGMTSEQYQRMMKLQMENQRLRNEDHVRQGQLAMQRQMDDWYRQADELKAQYQSFDLDREAQNPRFVAMLKSGLPVADAYKTIHFDEFMAAQAQAQAAATEKQVVAGIRAKGNRPAENGSAPQSAFVVKDDVSKLTKRERAEIARRAAHGEYIEF